MSSRPVLVCAVIAGLVIVGAECFGTFYTCKPSWNSAEAGSAAHNHSGSRAPENFATGPSETFQASMPELFKAELSP
jgi:hypothetical protein